MSELDKYVLSLVDGTAITLNHGEGREAMARLTDISTSEKTLSLGNQIIMRSAVAYIVSEPDFQDMQKVKAGMWKCSVGHWHKKTETDCKDAVKQSDEMIKVIGADGPVDMKEILKDQNKPEDKREYRRENGEWYKIKKDD